ncbi:MAG: LytTR family transcriptional regulator DNA-binding domain-containing protein [Spirosomataceae bacterium]
MSMLNHPTLRTPIEKANILYLEAESNYTFVVFVDGKRLLLSRNVGILLTLLPEVTFLRLNKSQAVNAAYVSLMRLKHHQRFVRLSTGHEFKISRRRAAAMKQRLIQ